MPLRKGGLQAWYAKLAAFNIESLFSRPKVPGPPRTIFVNNDLPEDYYDRKKRVKKEHVYITNQVLTSKYTIITFVPRNLLEQFRRVANLFFLAIAILQFFPTFGTISPGLVIFPLLVVILVSAIKDGYEDIKRHQSDRRVNYSQVRVLEGGGWSNPNAIGQKSKTFVRALVRKSFKSSKVNPAGGRVPDIALVESGAPPEAQDRPTMVDEDTSPDVEFDEGDARSPDAPHWKKTIWEDVRVGDFVKILNEEAFPADILICATSEEENVCFIETKNLDGETNLKSRNAVPGLTYLRSAAVCADKSHAAFKIECDRPDPNLYKLNAAVIMPQGKQPIDLQTVLLRGTVLKNTNWVIGIVLFTGEDAKIVLNSGGTPSKRSKVERQMNPQVFLNLLLLAVMAIACGIVDSVLEHRDFPEGAPWLFRDDQSNDNPSINGLVTWAFALITFQNIIPISLYISIEAVRTIQAALIYYDKEICYDKTGQPALARNFALSDDLGQIEYIFSDKTGTLTQNKMVFRHCSVGGKVYKGDDEEDGPADDARPAVEKEQLAAEKEQLAAEKEKANRLSSTSNGSGSGSGSGQVSGDVTAVPSPVNANDPQLPTGVLKHFRNVELQQDLVDAVSADPSSKNATQARTLNGFFNVLALCHTVLAAVDPETGRVEYRAQSPDEAALVQAAADVGFVFRGRDREVLRLQTPFSEQIEEYELLNVLDFTSARKRMSIVLRKMDGEDSRIFLFSKGADNVIFERLKPGVNEELKLTTEQHLDQFASEGLRTLTLAYKVISDDVYESWAERYHDATVALNDREGKVEAVSDEIEQELRLLGATAIEDRLQDGVPETIADLKRAGIKVWVATGDKLETAIAIGYSTNLIAPDSNLVVVRGGDPEKGGRSVHEQMRSAVEDFFPESGILDDYGVLTETPPRSSSEQQGGPYALHRTTTNVSSIVGRNNGDRPGGFVLVIEGTALGFALVDDKDKQLLLRLAMQCEGVICCRVSPLQKAEIVRLVKDGIGAMTLAIGDGANDVSMIQAADVGVGINGEEGLQAVNSSDYAIAQFRFLKRLLLVHGHWSYARNGTMIVNFFYKNIVCIGVLWWFMIYCAWSSQYVFEYTYLLFWNVFWTLCPVIAIGIFDRIIDDDILMAVPELYRYGREGYWFGTKTFLYYMLEAVYTATVIFFIINYAYFTPTARPDGYDVALYEFSTTMVLAAVMSVNAFNGLNTTAWTGWVIFSVSIGIVLVWAYTAIYSLISPGWFYVPVYGNDIYLFRSAVCWLSLPLTFCLALAPRYVVKAARIAYSPTDVDILRYIRKTQPGRDIANDELLGGRLSNYVKRSGRSMTSSAEDLRAPVRASFDQRGSRTDMSTGIQSVHRGFDFATEENGVAVQRIQSNLSGRRNTERLASQGEGKRKRITSSPLFSLRRSLRKKRPTA